MKLKNFSALGVHGYLKFDIPLHEQLTFLVGPNGSGKSTALALLEAVITPSIKELSLLEFDEAELSFEDSGAKSIRVTRSDSFLRIFASWLDKPIEVKSLDRSHRDILANDRTAADEYFSNVTIELSTDPVFRGISDVAAPVFLGIERQHKRDVRSSDVSNQLGGAGAVQAIRSGVAARRLMRGNLAAGLQDTQLIVQEAYRNARRAVDYSQDKLRADVLLSAFKYTDIEAGRRDVAYNIDSSSIHKLNQSKSEIVGALAGLGLSPDLVNSKVDDFFNKLSSLAEKMETPGEVQANAFLEFLTNRGHVERLQDLISLVQEFKKKSDRHFNRINQFSSFISSFYSDSGKKVALDQIGRIVVSRKDGRDIGLDALSSGERQLIIIFAHIFFNSYGARSKVFVIDEPELSLHLRWQEILVESVTQASPEAQFIFATHSPEIVGEHRSRCVQV